MTVTAPAGCAWSASTSGAWLTITSGAPGSGAASVAYSVAANTSEQSRNGSLTVAGQNHAVTQQGRAAPACRYDLSSAGDDFLSDGGDGTFTVTAPEGCTWTAVSTAPWVGIRSGAQGSGSGTVAYRVERNTGIPGREAWIRVEDRTFTVIQAGDASHCEYSVAPVDLRPCMAAGTVTATLTTQAGCTWSVSSNVPWLTLPGGGSGTGSGAITIAFTDNYAPPRDGLVLVRWPTPTAGQNIRVAQAGCFYSVSQASLAFTAAGGTGSFNVIQFADPNTCGGATQDRCVWTAQSSASWITVTTSMPQSGDNPVQLTVAANTTGAARTGTITVRDKVVTVSQAQ